MLLELMSVEQVLSTGLKQDCDKIGQRIASAELFLQTRRKPTVSVQQPCYID